MIDFRHGIPMHAKQNEMKRMEKAQCKNVVPQSMSKSSNNCSKRWVHVCKSFIDAYCILVDNSMACYCFAIPDIHNNDSMVT